MGFVATPELGHQAVALGAQALARLAHRGGLDADGKSGDGAGLLIQVPRRLLGGDLAVAVLFDWDERARAIVAGAIAASGLRLLEWRAVPVDPNSLGERARATMPAVWHGLIAKPDLEPEEWEHRLYLARRRAEARATEEGVRMYLPSCSSRTVVYKGLMDSLGLNLEKTDLKYFSKNINGHYKRKIVRRPRLNLFKGVFDT